METPLVSVFMPVYNSEQYIAEALESILNQTYKNLEIILVDDGSTDKSVEIIKNYNDKRIKLIQNEKNMGIPYTRNVGLNNATGKYMAIMDSDDISLPNRIEKQVQYLEVHPDIDVVGSYYYKFNNKKTREIRLPYIHPHEIDIILMFYSPLSNPSSMVRLETVRKHQLKYNLNYFVAQDYGFWVEIAKHGGKIAVIPEFLLKYRTGHENITKKSHQKKVERRKKVIQSIHSDILSHYNIHLTNEELKVYSEFFSYNYWTIDDTENLLKVVEKLKNWAHTSKIFDKQLFMNILDDSIVKGISNQGISLSKKRKLFNQLVTNKSIKSLMYILIKHVYYQIK
jgi:glycosyltransferase involved in cell wall biosynthesis